MNILMQMTENQLRSIGITSFGQRYRIHEGISDWLNSKEQQGEVDGDGEEEVGEEGGGEGEDREGDEGVEGVEDSSDFY